MAPSPPVLVSGLSAFVATSLAGLAARRRPDPGASSFVVLVLGAAAAVRTDAYALGGDPSLDDRNPCGAVVTLPGVCA